MKQAMLAIGAMAALLSTSAATQAEPFGGTPPRLPFVATSSNNTPLTFGMDAEQTARALGQPLQYVQGRPGKRGVPG